ncbi:hypothetical protein [Pedobacter jejuensis]|uniref:Uncharacterized protein n=1 Tax=Pedobacter jejuensis TaxID=1268550 RepID=A0A3N0BXW2_9SPHI|nr:hypothetical protein [Pedobacter jejuensis]RNL54591.1 hypothetical protein D7004_07325 [Pedobacter jejuensis]
MENFNITVNNINYLIEPQDNGTYRVMDGEEKIGVIYAESVDEKKEWRTLDELESEFVSAAGEQIAIHNN